MHQNQEILCAAEIEISPMTNGGMNIAASSGGDAVADRFTDLPEALRLHILTLLPFKYAVRTGALSTRWAGLWRQRWPVTASLDVVAPNVPPDLVVARINHLIKLHPPEAQIDTIQIALRPRAEHLPDVANWVDYAISVGVADLLLDLSSPSPDLEAPARQFVLCFESENLARLRLGGCCLSRPPSDFRSFCSLEIVFLYRVLVTCQTIFSLTTNCQLLRTLDIRDCDDLVGCIIVGPSPRLTSITVVDGSRAITGIDLDAPALRSIRLLGDFVSLTFVEFLELEDVYINWDRPDSLSPAITEQWMFSMSQLSNIRVLTLCGLSLHYITTSGLTVQLPNLVELQLLMPMLSDNNLADIYGFLYLWKCPRLERFFTELPTAMHDTSSQELFGIQTGNLPMAHYQSHFDRLTVVKMKNFSCHLNQVRLMRFFFECAARLKVVALVADPDIGMAYDVCDLRVWLNELPKLSGAVAVLLENDCSELQPVHHEAL